MVSLLPLIAWAMLAAGPPAPDEKKAVRATCPVDDHTFQAFDVTSQDFQRAWGGLDRDFCRHAFKTTPLEYAAWVCPSCGFAALKSDFEPRNALPEELRKRIRGQLRPGATLRPGMRQDLIPGHVKFDLLGQVELLKESAPEKIGRAWLNASWCARQQGAVPLEGLDEWIELRKELGVEVLPIDLGTRNRTELELEAARRAERRIQELRDSERRDRESVKALDERIADLRKRKAPSDEIRKLEAQRGEARGRLHHLKLLKYAALFLHRRHGENVEALRWIDELSRERDENSVIDDAVRRTAASIETERGYQRKAQEQFEKAAAAGKLDARAQAEVEYLLGELHRRLGSPEKARERYRKAIEGTQDATLKLWAEEQLKKVP